jgi:rhamnosyltransferase
MGSFFWMLENIDATYYMFCDHDDIWLPQKVELSLSKIREIERDNRPALVCCDLVVTDSNLNTIGPSLWSYMKLRPELLTKLKYAISCNLFTGCTMIINRAARDISLPISPRAVMHDSWIGLRVLAAGGDVAWIPTPLILYRQHTDNLFGAHRVSRSRSYYLHKLRTIKGVMATYRQNFLMAKDALGGRVSVAQYLFYRILYLIRR